MDNYDRLWELVQLIYPTSPLPAATLQLELDQYQSRLLNLFKNKVSLPGTRGLPCRSCSEQ